jgi:hypothetical protein
MAKKKKSKSPARKTRKSGGKTARRPARKTSRAASAGPVPVKTGRGAGPAEIGEAVVSMIRSQAGDKAIWDKWWSPRCESVEGGETKMAWKGRKQIQAKSDWWTSDNEMVGGSVEGPYLGATGFSVRFRMQVRTKSTGKVTSMEEVGVYTVQDGKVIREEFMGLCPPEGPGAVEAKPEPAAAGMVEGT